MIPVTSLPSKKILPDSSAWKLYFGFATDEGVLTELVSFKTGDVVSMAKLSTMSGSLLFPDWSVTEMEQLS